MTTPTPKRFHKPSKPRPGCFLGEEGIAGDVNGADQYPIDLPHDPHLALSESIEAVLRFPQATLCFSRQCLTM